MKKVNKVNIAAINATTSNDVLVGTPFDDTLDGGLGADTMIGGQGNDTYYVDNAGDLVVEYAGQGNDTVYSSISYTLGAELENLTLLDVGGNINATGNSLNNVLIGNIYNNILNGGVGADTMMGGLGNDIYHVDNAGDVAVEYADAGIDTVSTRLSSYALGENIENLVMYNNLGDGNIRSVYGVGNDKDNVLTVSGNSNRADVLDGGRGADTMSAGGGDDTYYVDNIRDKVSDTDGTSDTIISTVSYSLVDTDGAGAYGGTIEKLVLVGLGLVGTGNTLNNTYTIYNLGNSIVEGMGGGVDTVISSVSYTLDANVENLKLMASGLTGTGNGLDNTFTVNYENCSIIEAQGGGMDTVYTDLSYYALSENVEKLVMNNGIPAIGNYHSAYGVGNSNNNILMVSGNLNRADVLNGGLGTDTMSAGGGGDTYYVDNIGDLVSDTGGTSDTIISTVSYSLVDTDGAGAYGGTIEKLALIGTDNINGTGNALNNTLTGNSGNNILDGVTGADVMQGGQGDDTYYVNSTDDKVVEYAGYGTDTIISMINYSLVDTDGAGSYGGNVENLTLSGTAINGTGNSMDNIITGNSAVNTLAGGAGNDTYVVQNTADVVSESLGAGTDTVLSSADYTLSGHVENLTLTGTAISGTGNGLDNVLTGNNANNTLSSGAGADTLSGGLGQDVLIGDVGNDTYLFRIGDGQDTITDYDTTAGNFDTLYLQDAYTTDVTLARNGDNLVVNVGLAGDSVTIVNWFLNGESSYIVESIKFADATVWNEQMIRDMLRDMLNTAPYLNSNVPDVVIATGQQLSFTVPAGTFIDLDPGDTLTYQMTNADGSALPAWLTFNGTTLSGTAPQTSATGIRDLLDLKVTATDSAGATADDIFTLVVKPVGLELSGTGTLTGNDGDDIILGSAGAERMVGGFGNDTYVVNDTGDVVVEGYDAYDGNSDTVQSSINYTLGNYVENLTLTGAANINGTGNAANNVLAGNDGNNTLNGLSGADIMSGGQGNDTYVVQDTGDVVNEGIGAGTDTVLSSISYMLGDNVENLTLTGSAISGTGNGLNNIITGNNAANTLSGGVGSDTLTGGAGADIFVFDTTPGAGNVDTIADFTGGSDDIHLAQAMFSGCALGDLSATAFVSGAGVTSATTANERIAYDTNTGMLYYDADGVGGADSVVFATLTAAPVLSASGIAVV